MFSVRSFKPMYWEGHLVQCMPSTKWTLATINLSSHLVVKVYNQLITAFLQNNHKTQKMIKILATRNKECFVLLAKGMSCLRRSDKIKSCLIPK